MPTLTEWTPSRARGPRQGPIRGEVWGRGRPGQEWVSPQPQPARGGHTRPPATSASGCTAHPVVTMLGTGEGAFLPRSPLGIPRLPDPQASVSECILGVGPGCTDSSQVQRGGGGWARRPWEDTGGPGPPVGSRTGGQGPPSYPLSIAGKVLMGSELSQVPSPSSSCSLVPPPSSPLGNMHAASSPASLSDRAVIGEFPYK